MHKLISPDSAIDPLVTASTHTKGKNGEILSITWTRRQMLRSCGELLKEFMAKQNAKQRTKLLPSTESRSHRPSG